jgi:hypothetical protein
MRSRLIAGTWGCRTTLCAILLLTWAAVVLAEGPHGPAHAVAFAYSARDQGYISVPVSYPVTVTPFISGTIDLTGDGDPEIVSIVGGGLHIQSGAAEAWRSEPGWQVADVALGDPNNDGRFEALVAFLTPDAVGRLRSQPFIVGCRRGLFGALWGGSPVERPIREVKLADVDGDGAQELLTIESASSDLSDEWGRPTIWRWHGWGFSLQWSGPPGHYRGLQALDVNGDALPDLVVAETW